MIDQIDISPSIFRPITLRIDRVYGGPVPSGTFVAFAETGKIGRDEIFSCAFGSPTDLRIRGGPSLVTVGGTYVVLLAKELLTGRNDGPLEMPIIDNLFAIQGDHAIGLNGKPEPLPS